MLIIIIIMIWCFSLNQITVGNQATTISLSITKAKVAAFIPILFWDPFLLLASPCYFELALENQTYFDNLLDFLLMRARLCVCVLFVLDGFKSFDLFPSARNESIVYFSTLQNKYFGVVFNFSL